MRDGRTVASGRHEELLTHGVPYGELAASQMLRTGGDPEQDCRAPTEG
jgi:ATP-binding cassette subfamily B protein/ATP-binding cassette subfamily C protein